MISTDLQRGKTTMFVSTQQFSKILEKNFADCLEYIESVHTYPVFCKLDDITHTYFFDVFIQYLVSSSSRHVQNLRAKFQRFIHVKCLVMKIDKIDLLHLQETCTTYDTQCFLLISILYYFNYL